MSQPAILLKQRQALALTQTMRQSLDVLRMNNEELERFLVEAMQRNPFLRMSARSQGGTVSASDMVQQVRAPGPSLAEHVDAQIRLLFKEPAQVRIAHRFAAMLNPSGWLDGSAGEVAAAAGCPLREAQAVLERLQECEPAGLFAGGLAECLRLQARETGILDAAMAEVLDNLTLLEDGGVQSLASATGLELGDVNLVLSRLRRLNPKPGAAFVHDVEQPAAAELVVFREADSWRIELQGTACPSVEVASMADAGALQSGSELAAALQEARALRKAVLRRHATLLRIGRVAVGRQIAFLEQGPEALARQTLTDVAEAIGLSTSTISRAVAGCRIETPRGVMALSVFFDRGSRKDAPTMTIARVRHELATLFAQEPSDAPLSDQAAAERMALRGFALGRRAIAKHRAALNIPNQHLRRGDITMAGH